MTPQELLHSGDSATSTFCVTMLNSRVSVLQGIMSEVLSTAILVFIFCAMSDPRNSRNVDSNPIKFGLAVTGICFGFVPYSGCSMNPARSFGPALLNNEWSRHWIYWFAPFGGALAGSLFYKALFVVKPREQNSIGPENGV